MHKRIAFFVNQISFGGGERIINMIIDQIRLRGYEVYVYTYNPQWAETDNVFNKLRILSHRPVLGSKFKSFQELKKILKEDSPDCLISITLAVSEIAVWAAHAVGIPFITSERCDPWQIPEPNKRIMHRWLRLLTFAMSDGIVFQTNKVRDFFPNFIRKHSRVIHNPVIDSSLPAPCIATEVRKEIVSVGRLSPEKNFGMLIDAFSKLKNADGYTLKIYGDGPLKNSLQQQIDTLNLSGRVLLMGKVNRVVDHIYNSDIFVLPSDHEGMPNALIEGLAMGLACISTDMRSGGASELITDSENGLLIPVRDTEALVTAIDRLIKDEGLKNRLKKNAIKIRETHSKDIIIPLWIDYIEQICISPKI